MRIIKIIQDWHAAWQQQKLIANTGGYAVYESEQQEIIERQNAIPVSHAIIRSAFDIADSLTEMAYDTKAKNVIELIGTLIPLSPKTAVRSITQTVTGPGPSGQGDSTGWGSVEYKKDYKYASRLHGLRFFDLRQALGAFAGFSYYFRELASPDYAWRSKAFKGGIHASNLQFSSIIHDGYELQEIDQSRIAGIDTGHRNRVLKQSPVRVAFLGEANETSDMTLVRRVIIDGNKMDLTRENVALGLAYATELVDQIFSGRDYDPKAAMQKATASLPRFTAPLQQHGRT